MLGLLSRCKSLAVAVFVSLVAATSANAQDVAADVQSAARQWAAGAIQSADGLGGNKLRMDLTLGALDPRLKLAPCGNMEPYLPVGAKLWGKTRIAVRCVDGLTRWNVSLPATINAWGLAWVVRNPVAAGAALVQSDVVQAEVNWAEEPSAVLADASQWMGLVAARPLTTGQALRTHMLRPAQVFQVGSQVRVVAQGVGFQVASDGQALTAGIVGQLARVRMDNGRVTTGMVLDLKTVKIDL